MEVTPDFIAESICDDMYLMEEIVDMEIEILRTLDWQLNGPTVQDYLLIFMEVIPPEFDEEAASSFLQAAIGKMEFALLDYRLAMETPSSLAVAIVTTMIGAMDMEKQQALGTSSWMRRIGIIIGTSSNNLLNQQMNG